MRKSLIPMAVLTAALHVPAQATEHPPACVMSRQEQAVVVAYFNTPALSRNLIGFPHRTTALTKTSQVIGSTALDLDSINLQLAGSGKAIPADARTDFKAKAEGSCEVGKLSGLRGVRVISAPAQGQHQDGKDRLLVRVSRVGFDKDGTIAVMHVSYYAKGSGGGCLYVFERKAGKWVIRSESPTWTT